MPLGMNPEVSVHDSDTNEWIGPELPLGGITGIMAYQDAVIARNRADARNEFTYIERGLNLGWAIQVWLNGGTILARRCTLGSSSDTPETVRINLLHAAWSSLINATRLAFYGAHVDAATLIRFALESAYHAEYFTDHPSAVADWCKASDLPSLDERRKHVRDFDTRQGHIRRQIATGCRHDQNLEKLYYELCTYGSRANPMTVGLRLNREATDGANLGCLSFGLAHVTRRCALQILIVLEYTLALFRNGFPLYLNERRDLMSACSLFLIEARSVRDAAAMEGASMFLEF